MAFRGDHASRGNSKALSVQRLGYKYSRLLLGAKFRYIYIYIYWVFLKYFFSGFVLPLSLNNVLTVILVEQQLVFIYLTVLSHLRSLQIARQMSSFTSTLPRGWASITFLSMWIWLLYPLRRDGWQRGSSYAYEINKTCHPSQQRWALRLFAALA